MPRLALADFSGGLNLRDSPNELALNETPDALNWTLDTRGTAQLRRGCENVVAAPGDGANGSGIFYSQALDQWLCAAYPTGGGPSSTQLHLYTRPGDFSGSWTDRGQIATWNANTVSSFLDFPGATPKVVISTASGMVGNCVFTWNGTALTTITTTAQGGAMALWQNRVWLAGYPRSDANGNPSRLFASKIGDPAVWAPPDGLTVDLREKDGQALTALAVAGGALLVFKRNSAYRVNDSATGAYTTMDPAVGCLAPHSKVAISGRVYAWAFDGLYAFDGVGPGVKVGDKARPLFAIDISNYFGGLNPPLLFGGVHQDRAVFSYIGSTGVADLLEYDPTHGWLMKHALPSSVRSIYGFARKDNDLYAFRGDTSQIVKVFSGTPGSDCGVSFASNNFRTPWLQPVQGKMSRILRAQLEGLLVAGGSNTLTLNVYTDWDLSAAAMSFSLATDLRAGDSLDQVETALLYNLAHSRSYAFEFVAGGSGAASVNSVVLESVSLEV